MPRAVAILFALLLAWSLPSSLQAQRFGFKAGVSLGNVSDDELLPGDVTGRFGVTLLLSAFTPGRYAVGADLLYSQRGVAGAQEPESREIDYLDLPVLFRASVPGERLTPFVVAGPQVSREVDCDAGPAPCPGGRPKWPWSAVVGAGVRLGGEAGLSGSLEARFIYGLTDLSLSPASSHRERSIMVLAGVGL